MKTQGFISISLVLSSILSLFISSGFGQSLPDIFENTPQHLLKTEVLATYPKNSFLENIVEGNDGFLYVTNYPEGKILRISKKGEKEDYAKVEGKIAGIAKFGKNQFLVSGWAPDGKAAVFLVDADKNTSLFATIEGGMFPNGIIEFKPNFYLIADSFAGCIWGLETDKKSVKIWLKNDLLARSSETAQIPAANGLKVYKNALYVSNSERQILVKIPLSGEKPGTPETYLSKVFIDDFNFDSKGNLYAAANIYNNVLKITSSKNVSIIATLKEGAAGATSVLISKDPQGKVVLYIPTCGGMGVPPPSGIEEGKILVIHP